MAKSKTTSKGRKTPTKKRTKKKQVDYRITISLFILGLLFTILSVIPGESVWATVRQNFLFGVFGICGWLLGPLLIYLAVLLGFGKPIGEIVVKSVFIFLALSGAALVFGKETFDTFTFSQVLENLIETAKTNHFSGGIISIVLGWSLLKIGGQLAARILLVLIVLCSVMVFTGVTPADIVQFIKGKYDLLEEKRIERAKWREENEEYDDEYEDEYYDDEEYYEEPIRNSFFGRSKVAVDIDLGPGTITSEPGLAENDEVEIGPGGTFGMNPLNPPKKKLTEEPLLPFDPYSNRSLLDGAEEKQPNILLIEEIERLQNANGTNGANSASSNYINTVNPFVDERSLDIEPESRDFRTEFPVQNIPKQPENTTSEPSTTPIVTSTVNTPTQPTNIVPENSFGDKALQSGTFAGEVDDTIIRTDGVVNQLIDKAAAQKEDISNNMLQNNVKEQNQAYAYPPISLFEKTKADDNTGAKEEMHRTAELLTGTLESFGVQTKILDVSRGPSVTRYEIQPQKGVKISRITNLADDIALNLAAAGVRIEAPIPGKPAVGIEVPNRIKSTVGIRALLESGTFTSSTSPVSIALGKDIAGDCVVADLAKMPHLLIAGSTGSGKSVCVNATIMSFLYKSSPEDLKLILIDPKVVELAEYNGIPHLLMPVVTEPRKAAGALGAAVAEMEKRYHLFAENNVRDIKTYNKLVGRVEGIEKMPYIAIIIDELADLMMVAGKDVETYICRIAQKARAAGMHLIVATQRPSVDVITGLIKANIPSRIAFAVSSQVDSRTILDGAGAEKLLGMGDMLFMPVGANKPVRVQGTYVTDEEISSVLDYIKQNSTVQYDEGMIQETDKCAAAETNAEGTDDADDSFMKDPTFINAVEIALDAGQISTSNLQRRLRLGYARAGRIVDQMEQLGIISGPNGSKPRELLITRQDWLELSMNKADKAQNEADEF